MKIDAKHFFFMLSHKIYPNFLERKKRVDQFTANIDIASNIRRFEKVPLFFFYNNIFLISIFYHKLFYLFHITIVCVTNMNVAIVLSSANNGRIRMGIF